MARAGAAAALACAGVMAHAQDTNFASIYSGTTSVSAGPSNAPASVGTLAPINLNTWIGPAANFAEASGATQTLRVLAAASGSTAGQLHPQSLAQFRWTTVVGGAVLDAPVTVSIDLHVDGRLEAWRSASGAPSGYNVATTGFVTLSYSVSDTSLLSYDSEGYPDFRFIYTGQTSIEAQDALGYRRKIRTSLATANLQGGSPWAWSGNIDSVLPENYVSPEGQVALSVNTGVLSFSFDTFVGHQLALDGYFRAEAFGNSPGNMPWQALADFANTFDIELRSSDPAVTFSGITPGVFQPVPEPATLALMLTGIAGVLLRVRAGRVAAS
jgi:hypothetical protein